MVRIYKSTYSDLIHTLISKAILIIKYLGVLSLITSERHKQLLKNNH